MSDHTLTTAPTLSLVEQAGCPAHSPCTTSETEFATSSVANSYSCQQCRGEELPVILIHQP